MYDDWGNALIGNTFSNDGYFGNPTNGDAAELTLLGGEPINCYYGNTDTDGTFTSSPANLETTNTKCGTVNRHHQRGRSATSSSCCRRPATPRRSAPGFCPAGQPGYPRVKKIVMHPLPKPADDAEPVQGRPRQPMVPGATRRGP